MEPRGFVETYSPNLKSNLEGSCLLVDPILSYFLDAMPLLKPPARREEGFRMKPARLAPLLWMFFK